jgi:hypothetical protein
MLIPIIFAPELKNRFLARTTPPLGIPRPQFATARTLPHRSPRRAISGGATRAAGRGPGAPHPHGKGRTSTISAAVHGRGRGQDRLRCLSKNPDAGGGAACLACPSRLPQNLAFTRRRNRRDSAGRARVAISNRRTSMPPYRQRFHPAISGERIDRRRPRTLAPDAG